MSDFYAVEQALQSGAPIITPGRRLADALQAEWARLCAARGRGVWRRPSISALEERLRHCWERLLLNGDAEAAGLLRIGADAEQSLWEKIIEDDPECDLLQPAAAAAHAREAHALLQRWRIDPTQVEYASEFQLSGDGRRFLHWREKFLGLCAERRWCSDGAAEELTLRAFQEGALEPEPQLLLYGFEEMEKLPPLRRALLEASARELLRAEAPRGAPQKSLLKCPDPEQEIRAAARWARRAAQADPAARIAVAHPQLESRRATVERIFRETFSPGEILPDSPPSEGLFNIAAPWPLSRAPLTDAALQLLELVCSGLPPMSLRALLDSPFWAAERESAESLGALAARLLEWRGERVSLQALQQLAAECGAEVLDEALRNLAAAQREAGSERWAARFWSWLDAWGWPGSRSPDSAEHQQRERLEKARRQFAAESEVYGALRPAAALLRLRKILQNAPFQPRRARVQVDILTLPEARGLRFDRLWLCGMEQSVWPPLAEPNPLLPAPVQRSCGMPGADPDRERERNAEIAAELLASARLELTVSYPAMDEERELGVPGFFFAGLEPGSIEELCAGTADPQRQWLENIRTATQTEPLPEARTAPCAEQPASGEVSLLRDQAACSFRAFAHHRLGVYGRPQRAEPILNDLERGAIVHDMLQFFWDEMKDSASLRACSAERRRQVVSEAAATAVEDAVLAWQRSGASPRPRFWELERRRLSSGLEKWLEKELEYAGKEGEFEVCATEERRELQLDGLMRLRLRIDRLEKRGDGALVLLDYKTGRAAGYSAESALRRWRGPYPEDPQLPLYALACAEDGPLHALGWGFVDVRELRRTAPSAADLDGASWDELCGQWREDFIALAREYCAGGAEVRPRSANACEECAMQALCRIRDAG